MIHGSLFRDVRPNFPPSFFKMPNTRILSVVFALLFIAFGVQAAEVKKPSPVRVVYFIPTDREPLPDRHERLGRVMKYVQDFYRDGMVKNGYGPMTFELEWDAPGKLKLYTVQAKHPMETYVRTSASAVKREVDEALRTQYKIDPSQEVVVIFQLLLKWNDDKATEVGPYVGGGSHLSGTAWVYEDAKLDPRLLPSKEPGGYYHRPCSLGQFNTHYIGGTAHEMGHAFSLPHACELDTEREKFKARALMGSGNHTFGMDLRGEGIGTFLAPSSALRLSRVRAFAGDLPGTGLRASWVFDDLKAAPKQQDTEQDKEDGKKRSFMLSGRTKADPKLAGIIVYNDNLKINADYDAKTWTAPVDEQGRFELEITELETVPYQLRIVGIHENGASSRLAMDYNVLADKIDLSSLNMAVPMDNLRRLFQVGNKVEIERIAAESKDNTITERARHLIELLGPIQTVKVAESPEETKTVDLTFAEFTEARTGWGALRRGHVPEDVFLQVGGIFSTSGLYAHAPAVFKVDLDGKWNTFAIQYGLQDGHDGPVRFIVKGDGKELHRSETVKEHNIAGPEKPLPVKGIKTLELLVEPAAASGNSGAWGVWLNPVLSR